MGATCHVLWTEGLLLVANTGRPFSHEGVEAICAGHGSSKFQARARPETPVRNEREAQTLLKKLQDSRLKAYHEVSGDIEDHARGEAELRKAHAGRVLFELLQNAADAAGDRPIGYKGLGFKAVLNLSDEPRIHSGPLHLCFDAARSEDLLTKNDFDVSKGVPRLRLPFAGSLEDEDALVRHLAQSYTTTVVLPLRGKEANERLKSEWEALVNEPTLLLFVPGLERVVWERRWSGEVDRVTWHCRRQANLVELATSEGKASATKWRLWTAEKAALAVREGSDGQLEPVSEYPKLRAFFPTEHDTPVPLYLHLDLPLSPGRTSVEVKEAEQSGELGPALAQAAELVANALEDARDAGRLLDLIAPRVDPEKMGNSIERPLWDGIAAAVRPLLVPGTQSLRWNKVRLRPQDLPYSWFGGWGEAKKERCWWAFKELLVSAFPDCLDWLPFLPAYVDEGSAREKTVLALNPSAWLTPEELRDLPLLPIEGRPEPVAASEVATFFPPPPSVRWPRNLDLHVLTRPFMEAINKSDFGMELRAFLEQTLGVSRFQWKEVVDKGVLPILRRGRQPRGLLRFLSDVVDRDVKPEEVPFNWRDGLRRELAQLCHVPVRDGASRPAIEVYAGWEWVESDALERAYGTRPDRAFLAPPPTNKKERAKREKLYRFLGIGWAPKVLPILWHEEKAKTKEGAEWHNGRFALDSDKEPVRWAAYCEAIADPADWDWRIARMRSNWMLDGGSKVLNIDGMAKLVSRGTSYYELYQHATVYQSSNKNYDKDNRKVLPSPSSYLMWLMRKEPWLPTSEGRREATPMVFVRGEVTRELSGWVHELAPEVSVGEEGQAFAALLGLRSGWSTLEPEDWIGWLKRAGAWHDREVEEDRSRQDAIHRLYRAALRHFPQDWSGKPRPPLWQGPVWAVERHPDNVDHWVKQDDARDVFYVDRADLDAVRLPRLMTFPVRLEDYQGRAKELFGVRPLSAHVRGMPGGDEQRRLTQQLRDRLKARDEVLVSWIEWACERNQWEGAKAGHWSHARELDFQVRDLLTVNFELDGQPLGKPAEVKAYYDPSSAPACLYLSSRLFQDGRGGLTAWNCVAAALVYSGALPREGQKEAKDLLACEEDELEHTLSYIGLPLDTVWTLVGREPAAFGQEPAKIEGATEAGEGEAPGPFQGEDHQGVLRPRGGAGAGGTPAGGPGGGVPGTHPGRAGREGRPGERPTTDRDRAGKEAEDHVRARLRMALEALGWKVSDQPLRDAKGREVDVGLRHPDNVEFYVEVKDVGAGFLFWSALEVDKAKSAPDRYIMAIARPASGGGFETLWLPRPLDVLRDSVTSGRWVWNYEETVEDIEPWDIPQRDEREGRFSFIIDVQWDELAGRDETLDEDGLVDLLETFRLGVLGAT